MAFTGLAIAAALALAKNKLIDQPAADRQRKLAASTQRLSPWTGLQAQAPQDPNVMGDLLDYGVTGAKMGSNYAKANPSVPQTPGAAGGSAWNIPTFKNPYVNDETVTNRFGKYNNLA